MEDAAYALGVAIGQFLKTAILWTLIIGAILLLARYMLHRRVDVKPQSSADEALDSAADRVRHRNQLLLGIGVGLSVLVIISMCNGMTAVSPRASTPDALARVDSSQATVVTLATIPPPTIDLPSGLTLRGLVAESLFGTPHVAFVLTNEGTSPVKAPRFRVTLYRGTVIVQESEDWCSDLTLSPGDWDVCDMYLEDLDAWSSWAIRVAPGEFGSDRTMSGASAGLKVVSSTLTNGRTLNGQIDNVTASDVDHISVIAIAYNSSEQICAVGDGYAKAETIPPGMSSLYEIYTWTGEISEAATFDVLAYERY